MEKDLVIFENSELAVKIRTLEVDGDVWFLGKDLAEALGYRDGYTATRGLDDDEKLIHTICVGSQDREVTFISESGLYSLILSSKLPTAKAFKKWVTSEVLPTIRKHGMYAVEELLDNPDLLIQTATRLKEEREARILAEEEVKELTPKAEGYDTLMDTDSYFTMTEASNILKLREKGKVLGRNNLIKLLKHSGILQSNNIPYQTHSEHFKVVAGVKGRVPYKQTVVTIKGLDYLRKKFVYLK